MGFEGDVAAVELAVLLPSRAATRGRGTDSLVVPAGWLSLLKPHPANYSLRMPSWLSNGETGDRTVVGPLTGLQVLQVSNNTPTLGQMFFFLSALTLSTEWAGKLSLILLKPIY